MQLCPIIAACACPTGSTGRSASHEICVHCINILSQQQRCLMGRRNLQFLSERSEAIDAVHIPQFKQSLLACLKPITRSRSASPKVDTTKYESSTHFCSGVGAGLWCFRFGGHVFSRCNGAFLPLPLAAAFCVAFFFSCGVVELMVSTSIRCNEMGWLTSSIMCLSRCRWMVFSAMRSSFLCIYVTPMSFKAF